jgi:hypothetical protein
VKRRTLLKSVAAALVARPAAGLAQAAQTAASTFTAADIDTLRAIADVVLPEQIGAPARERAVSAFVRWHDRYREGADMGHTYGASTVRTASGPAPARRYPPQFASLRDAAVARGAKSFALLSRDARRAVIEAQLNTPTPVTRMPGQPTGASLIADLMGSFFNGPDGWDACYGAEIRRYACRTLDDSAEPPAPIRRG